LVPLVPATVMFFLVPVLADGSTSAPPSISASRSTVVEGDQGTSAAVFTVRLSRASVRPVSVRFTTADGSARAGEDYVASRGIIVFQPGQRSTKVAIRVIGDTLPEAQETFFLVLFRPRGARIATRRATTTIAASDLPAPFTLRAEMTGAEYVPQPGHPTGRGTVVLALDPEREEVAYTITVSGMEVGESGLCQGARGQAPSPLLRLDYPPEASGSKHLELATILEMFRAPEQFCALARLAFSAPGIRGQLFRAAS
jgi:hypothetical protein